jgi:hypothetical protein
MTVGFPLPQTRESNRKPGKSIKPFDLYFASVNISRTEFGANLNGVVGLADKVISRCHRYLSAVKDCPSDLRAILIETSTVKSVIENLEFLCKNSPNPELKQFFLGLDSENGPIRGSRECLAKLDRLLPEDKTEGTTGGKRTTLEPTLTRLAWPLHETKARKLLDELGRFRASISAALVTDISYVAPRRLETTSLTLNSDA